MPKRKIVELPPHITIRAMEIAEIAKRCDLTEEQRKWCEIVEANNAPGQKLQVEPSIIEALQGKSKEPPKDEDLPG